MAELQDLELLRASIMAHDAQFQELMCMIPPKYYITQPQLSISSLNSNASKSRKKKKKLQEPIDAETKRLKKRAKYDPDTLPTIPQLQGLNKSSETNLESISQPQKLQSGSQEKQQETGKSEGISPATQLSRAELQAKLQQRIEILQGSSQRKQIPSENQEVSGLNGKEALLDLERKKRGEMRDRRRKERKEARNKEKQLKQEENVMKKNKKLGLNSKNSNNNPSGTGNLQKGQKSITDSKNSKETSEILNSNKSTSSAANSPSKPETRIPHEAESSQPATKTTAANQEPNLAFSSLSFDLKQSSGLIEHQHGHKNPSWTSKKPQEAKIALDRREAYLSKLTPEARERAEEGKKWEKANLQVSGTKVMDDRKKIEKSIKKEIKEKKKKKNQWDERIKLVEKLKEEKQKKRNENIKKRKDQIKDKKLGASSSTGVKAKGNFKSNKPNKSVKGF